MSVIQKATQVGLCVTSQQNFSPRANIFNAAIDEV